MIYVCIIIFRGVFFLNLFLVYTAKSGLIKANKNEYMKINP